MEVNLPFLPGAAVMDLLPGLKYLLGLLKPAEMG